jgi:hypothetical protein
MPLHTTAEPRAFRTDDPMYLIDGEGPFSLADILADNDPEARADLEAMLLAIEDDCEHVEGGGAAAYTVIYRVLSTGELAENVRAYRVNVGYPV